jgi:SAM-dependent methyltransferase
VLRLALFAVCFACASVTSPKGASTPVLDGAQSRPSADAPEPQQHRNGDGADPELNDAYRDPADLRAHIRRFEHEGREVRDRKSAVLYDLSLKPDMVVADLGAGTGLYTLDLARAVGPGGRVYAVDIIPHFLAHIGRRAAEAGLHNITLVDAARSATDLPSGGVDLVFMCDVFHHLERPAEVLADIRRILRPGGQLVVVDLDRVPGKSPKWILDHVRADKSATTRELLAAGFVLTSDRTAALGLRDNYLLHLLHGPPGLN